MRRKIYFDSQYGVETYALCEDGKIVDYCAEPAATGAVVGNVYKGRVTDVLNGMQAAFIDCGLERHCYLSASDQAVEKGADGESYAPPKELNLQVGDEIMVQITKAPHDKKGAKVTANLSFVGKYTVFMPTTPFVGVSAKISDHELRKNLLFSAGKQLEQGEGLVVRTAAPYAVLSTKVDEIKRFRKLYQSLLARFKDAPVGELLYSDSPLYMRVLRDLMLQSGDEIHVGTQQLYDNVSELALAYTHPSSVTLHMHDPHTDMFYSEGLYQQFASSLLPKVELENGAYLVIDLTEALTVIDVNTGKFTGEDNLEHTVYCTNVLAAREIASQVKLRNLGGLFVVDFIDMAEENHRKAIVEELEKALKTDKAKCRVLPMSRFGLVEFTRKRTGVAASEMMLKTCNHCGGAGVMRSHESILGEFRAKLLNVLSQGATTVCVDLNFDIANRLMAYGALKENIAQLYPHARVYIIFHRTYREDCMYFRRVDSPNFALPEGTVLLY
ncbi:MAG: Rne/Rng family ribonuclease [Clostridia bacterium]|nr:Rne/Rng family ribonuclease [Clostridia bacterium]